MLQVGVVIGTRPILHLKDPGFYLFPPPLCVFFNEVGSLAVKTQWISDSQRFGFISPFTTAVDVSRRR